MRCQNLGVLKRNANMQTGKLISFDVPTLSFPGRSMRPVPDGKITLGAGTSNSPLWRSDARNGGDAQGSPQDR